MKNPFKKLTKFEVGLWLCSLAVILLSAVFSGADGLISSAASVIGVTALIFVAKGMVTGQVLTVVFAVFYGIISFSFKYYGEVITYLCMTAPMAVFSVASWLRHPHEGSDRVEVARLTPKVIAGMIVSAIAVTAVFYFVLAALGNEALIVSAVSITTSWLASYLTFFRSPYYALAYAANDIVLIILWIIAAAGDISCLSMVFCFVMFLINDLYGFINWKKMQAEQ
ncbi:MAG: nicotinamide mononucleotide transporter [Clostridia bacterium]|nr:nicotinamide mononucleotide transporter [Clostridia bacterium]